MRKKKSIKIDDMKKGRIQKGIIFMILLLAAVRLIALSRLPEGVLPDEAYGAYNAWGLMTEGMDSRGYHWPVYFVAWGSGMSVLYSYLAVPLFRIFGSSILVYRLPQAVLGIVSVYALYLLCRSLWDEQAACTAAFVLAVNPWHIMNTRFGLDANMAPGMFLLGVLFLAWGLQKKRGTLILSAVFLGASLYCYALTWIMIPVFLVLCVLFFRKKIFNCGAGVLALFTCLLFVIAIPLILFVLINMGVLEEIRTPFLSIPRLPGFRGEELDFAHISESLTRLKEIVFAQYDGVSYTASQVVGAYYLFTTPFMIVGLICQIVSLCRNYKNGDNDLQYLMLFWTVSAVFMCALNENITMIHINMLHIPAIFYGVYGICRTAGRLKNAALLPACLIFWGISFGIFLWDYVSVPSGYFVDARADEALARAEEIAGQDGDITIFDYTIIKYSYLLWREKPSISDYAEKAVYEGDDAWAELISYGRYHYVNRLDQLSDDGLYIIYHNREESFRDLGFTVDAVNDLYSIARKTVLP